MGRTRTELTKGGQFFVEGLNDEELNFFNALMLISQDFTTQCLRSLLLRLFSKFKIIFLEL